MKLTRHKVNEYGVFGRLQLTPNLSFCTLEHNFNGAPAVPVGTYKCIRHPPNRLPYETFMLVNVPGHDGILFHIGNYNSDSIGCILLGQVESEKMILQSKQAFTKFMKCLEGHSEFTLEVIS